MEPAQRTISTAKLDIAILEAGDPNDPLALCLHGFPDTAHTWRHLLPMLAAAGFHAVAPFMRGYAPTGVPADRAYQAGALVADATALHEALGADGDAVLIGHDWGAMTAYGAGAVAPERWRRLVTLSVPPPAALMSSFFLFPQLKRSFYIFLFQTPLAEGAVTADDFAFLDGLWQDWTGPSYDPSTDLRHVKESLRGPDNVAAAIGYYRAMLDASAYLDDYAGEQEACSRIAPQPTLYLHGTDDAALGADVVNDATSQLSADSRVEFVSGANHFLHLENPAAVNALILDWVCR
ncbi:MAG: alpha/beta fold hydrolase [Actinomycetes bacterium]